MARHKSDANTTTVGAGKEEKRERKTREEERKYTAVVFPWLSSERIQRAPYM